MHRLLSVHILLVTDAGRNLHGQIGEGWKQVLESPDQLKPRPDNTRVQFRIGVGQPGGEELVVILDTERSIW
jgi:hypothetical protein